ncbi:M20/M25/M40 family metallo-hydrolase [Prolixibacteraceae bacterium JC049]|nr:M20/M25/M40 family metallo-hydrolase [Prolixibacteraceae bacterium JC049]
MDNNQTLQEVTKLLKKLIQTPSFSRDEKNASTVIETFLNDRSIPFSRKFNNIWCHNKFFNNEKPTILLNSHIDTVRATDSWTFDPFAAKEVDEKIIGLGSNDAGGPLVSLLATFIHFYSQEHLPFNLIFAASAEEEVSGQNGIASIIPELGEIDLAIVGEPTQMQMAIAEKGLMVVDCIAHGKSGHAARNEGVNAIYIAIKDIAQIENGIFQKKSAILGEVKTSVTVIEGGHQHNVVPDQCKFTIDVRTNEHYSNQKAFDIINEKLESECKARSYRLNSSSISMNHPLVKRGIELGLNPFGSPTLSDQALMPFTSIKIGPGDSARSHTADEFIYRSEIKDGIETYINLLTNLKL